MMMACTPSFICFLLCTKANSDKQKILLSDSSELISGPAEFHRSINLNGTMTPTDKNSAPEECEDAQLRHLDTINYNYLTLVGVLLPNIPPLNWSTRSLIGTTRPQKRCVDEMVCTKTAIGQIEHFPVVVNSHLTQFLPSRSKHSLLFCLRGYVSKTVPLCISFYPRLSVDIA